MSHVTHINESCHTYKCDTTRSYVFDSFIRVYLTQSFDFEFTSLTRLNFSHSSVFDSFVWIVADLTLLFACIWLPIWLSRLKRTYVYTNKWLIHLSVYTHLYVYLHDPYVWQDSFTTHSDTSRESVICVTSPQRLMGSPRVSHNAVTKLLILSHLSSMYKCVTWMSDMCDMSRELVICVTWHFHTWKKDDSQ